MKKTTLDCVIEFIRAYDEWACSPEHCGGPYFDAMLDARDKVRISKIEKCRVNLNEQIAVFQRLNRLLGEARNTRDAAQATANASLEVARKAEYHNLRLRAAMESLLVAIPINTHCANVRIIEAVKIALEHYKTEWKKDTGLDFPPPRLGCALKGDRDRECGPCEECSLRTEE